MRIGALVALLCVAACRNRPLARTAQQGDSVDLALPTRTRRAILLSGLDYPYGYLLIDPGGPERILTGVYADDDLLEELRVYFDLPDDTASAQPRIAT